MKGRKGGSLPRIKPAFERAADIQGRKGGLEIRRDVCIFEVRSVEKSFWQDFLARGGSVDDGVAECVEEFFVQVVEEGILEIDVFERMFPSYFPQFSAFLPFFFLFLSFPVLLPLQNTPCKVFFFKKRKKSQVPKTSRTKTRAANSHQDALKASSPVKVPKPKHRQSLIRTFSALKTPFSKIVRSCAQQALRRHSCV